MSPELIEVKYALDTFYFLICGVLVMWMAAGFTMLESGLVRAKSTTEILTKNIRNLMKKNTFYKKHDFINLLNPNLLATKNNPMLLYQLPKL